MDGAVTQADPLAAAVRAGLPAGWTLRPRTEADLPFLARLYAQTREEELRPVPWSAAQKHAFLAEQFRMQHEHYLRYYPGAQWWVLEQAGMPAGRLYVRQGSTEVRLMDVALLASHQRQGVGTAAVRALLAFAAGAGLAVTLHVEPFNPALRLYRRLGFRDVETRGVYLFMERAADAALS